MSEPITKRPSDNNVWLIFFKLERELEKAYPGFEFSLAYFGEAHSQNPKTYLLTVKHAQTGAYRTSISASYLKRVSAEMAERTLRKKAVWAIEAMKASIVRENHVIDPQKMWRLINNYTRRAETVAVFRAVDRFSSDREKQKAEQALQQAHKELAEYIGKDD